MRFQHFRKCFFFLKIWLWKNYSSKSMIKWTQNCQTHSLSGMVWKDFWLKTMGSKHYRWHLFWEMLLWNIIPKTIFQVWEIVTVPNAWSFSATQRNFQFKTMGFRHYRRHFFWRNATSKKWLMKVNLPSHRKTAKLMAFQSCCRETFGWKSWISSITGDIFCENATLKKLLN